MFRSVSEHFDVKRCKTCVSGLYALFRSTKVAKHPFYSIAPKMIYGSVTENYANLRHVIRWKLVFQSWMHYFGVPMLRSIHSTPLDRKWYMGVLRNTSLTLCTLKYENLNFMHESLFRGTKVEKHLFYSIGPKMIYGSVTEVFSNARKKMKTCISGLNALYRGTKVVKYPFYSIIPKMMFRSVSEHFDVKRCKTCVSGHQSCEVSILLHYTQNDV
jgi:hypothetical protein